MTAIKTPKRYARFGRIITDAKRDLDIRIKAADIKNAVCKDHQLCVVANAITRATDAPWVDVGPGTVIVGVGNYKGRRYQLDSLGRDVVRYFDENDGKAAPSRITLRAPHPRRQLGARTGEKGGHKRGGTHKRRRRPTR